MAPCRSPLLAVNQWEGFFLGVFPGFVTKVP